MAVESGVLENTSMKLTNRRAPIAAFAQPLTEELLTASGVTPGMRVLVLGRDLADLALLVAERVGRDGTVVGVHHDGEIVDDARRRAADEGFERVSFVAASLSDVRLDSPVDAVVARFFLMCEPDPVESVRRAASMVHDGGRVLSQEWHYGSMVWKETSDWPYVPLYRSFVRWSSEAMRLEKLHLDIGLRLPNIFAEAGLPLPALRSDLRTINGTFAMGYAFFESVMRELLPTIERHDIANAQEVDVEGFAARLEAETNATGGHVFLPLQIGAWSRVEE